MASENRFYASGFRIKRWVQTAVEAGVTLDELRSLLSRLSEVPSLPELVRQSPNNTWPQPVPEVRYDAANTARRLLELSNVGSMLWDSTALRLWIEEAFALGLTAEQLYTYTNACLSNGREITKNHPQASLGEKLRMPIDLEAVVAHWRQCWGSAWSPACETFVRQALPAALSDRAFQLGLMLREQRDRVLLELARASGILLP